MISQKKNEWNALDEEEVLYLSIPAEGISFPKKWDGKKWMDGEEENDEKEWRGSCDRMF